MKRTDKHIVLRLPKAVQLPFVYGKAMAVGLFIGMTLSHVALLNTIWATTEMGVAQFGEVYDNINLANGHWLDEMFVVNFLLGMPIICLFVGASVLISLMIDYDALKKPFKTQTWLNGLAIYGWAVFTTIVGFVAYHKQHEFLGSQLLDMAFDVAVLLCLTFRNTLLNFLENKIKLSKLIENLLKKTA